MAVPIAERVCDKCLERGDLEHVMTRMSFCLAVLGDLPAAEDAAKRLMSETERRLGPTHLRVSSALAFLAHFYLEADQPEKAKPYARRAWDILETALQSGPPSPELADFFPALWNVFANSKAPHLDRAASKAFFKAALNWTRVNRQPPQGVPIAAVIRALRGLESCSCASNEAEDPERKPTELAKEEQTRAELTSKRAESEQPLGGPEEHKRAQESPSVEERKREREERRRADPEEERERVRREAERADHERAACDAADLEAARKHVEGSQWARARPLLEALLEVLNSATTNLTLDLDLTASSF
eukprot:tig00000670_g3027.t1